MVELKIKVPNPVLVMLEKAGRFPRRATVSPGLLTSTVGVPVQPAPLMAPLRVKVQAVLAVASKVGVPAKETALPIAAVLFENKVVPAAMLTEPTPRGPLVRPAPPLAGELLAPTTTPPPLTVRPLKRLCPLS